MKKVERDGWVVIAIPAGGLFVKRGRPVDAAGEKVPVTTIPIFSTEEAAKKQARMAAQEQCDERERQLLDALRALQACQGVARNYRGEHREWGCVTSGNQLCGACKAYDALAGKGE